MLVVQDASSQLFPLLCLPPAASTATLCTLTTWTHKPKWTLSLLDREKNNQYNHQISHVFRIISLTHFLSALWVKQSKDPSNCFYNLYSGLWASDYVPTLWASGHTACFHQFWLQRGSLYDLVSQCLSTALLAMLAKFYYLQFTSWAHNKGINLMSSGLYVGYRKGRVVMGEQRTSMTKHNHHFSA